MKLTHLYFRHDELESKSLENIQIKQSASSRNPEGGWSLFGFSIRSLTLFFMFFGLVVTISWYLSTPDLMQAYPNWVSLQFNIVLVFLLVVSAVVLAIFAGLAVHLWQKNKNLRKDLEDEIGRHKETGKNLACAQEISKIGNWTLELPGRKIQGSDEMYQILDCSPKTSAITFQRFLKSVHPEDRGFVKKGIQSALNQGTAFNLTHRIVRRDGSIKIVRQRSEVYLDTQGKPTQINGILQDITDQSEAENLAARLGRILDKSFNEIYTFDAVTLKFIKVNLAARLNLRYKMEELREMTPKNLLPEFAWDQVERLIGSLKRGVESVTAYEAIHERKDGSTYPVDIRLQLSRTGLRSQFVAIVQDITDRKKVENLYSRAYQELDRRVQERTSDLMKSNKGLRIEVDEHKKRIEILDAQQTRLVKIMNNVVDGIITIDEEGIIHSFNRAAERLFGYTIEETLGQNINILMASPYGRQRDDYFKNLLQSKKSAALGLRRVVTSRKKDGTIFSAELAVNETVIGGQRMYTGLLRSLTDKMEIEQELTEILSPMSKS